MPHKTISRLVLSKCSVTLIQTAPSMFKINTEIWAVKPPLGRGTGWPARAGSRSLGRSTARSDFPRLIPGRGAGCSGLPASQSWVHLNPQQSPGRETTLSSSPRKMLASQAGLQLQGIGNKNPRGSWQCIQGQTRTREGLAMKQMAHGSDHGIHRGGQ